MNKTNCIVVLVSHAPTGQALYLALQKILNESLKDIHVFDTGFETTPDREALRSLVEGVNRPVLFLTDLAGSTPARLAIETADALDYPTAVVSGLSLAMLLRLANHREETLSQFIQIAIESASKATHILFSKN